jgi:prepilin-type N-terminal cleavage/methylation domain-containing protein
MTARPRTGFALIEVLVALTLLAVGTVGVLSAVLSALDVQRDAALRHRAGLLLQDKLAEVRVAPYAGRTTGGVTDDGLLRWTVVGAPWEGSPEMPHQGRRRRGAPIEVLPVYEVRVEVAWQGARGEGRVAATGLAGVTADAGRDTTPEVAP